MSSQSGLLRELVLYMRDNKKFWLLPMLAVLVGVGGLLVFAQGSALAPFIYTIF
ncbi:MAG: hypothetical protein KJT01_02260 [Gemmatimonadetes bacterium]|nr:hypothetical protein [Gemmatimonadota bacterium]